MAGPFHPVQQPAVLAAGEAVQGERRAQDVAAEPLATVAIAGVDPDACVEREPVENGTALPSLERLGIAQASLHLGGLQRGEGVLLRRQVLVVPDQGRRRPSTLRTR